MMPATKTVCRVVVILAVLATVQFNAAYAQDTLQIAASGEVRNLLQRAESMLAGNDSQGAYALLQAREKELAGHSYFDYLLGIAALDSGRLSDAILSLQRAAASAPQFSAARMELARAHFEAGESAVARALFAALLSEDPPASVRDVIDRYIAAIDARPGTPPSSFNPFAELLVGYDDNANGSTDNQQFLGFTLSPENLETDSSFFEGGAGFDWTVPKSANRAWYLGARAGYRSNPDAAFVDAGVVTVGGGALWRSGPVFGRANVEAYGATRDGKSNESYSGANFALGRNLNNRWDLNASLRAGALRYADAIQILDVNRVMVALGVAYRFTSRGRFSIELLGGSDDEQQSGSPYGNSKIGARLGVSSAIGDATFLQASIGSMRSDFDGQFFAASREDTQLNALLQLEFRDVITAGLTIAPRIRYIDNDSDVSLYDYDRTEIGLLIRWAP